MTDTQQYVLYGTLILSVIVLALTIILLIYSHSFAKYFASKKFNIKGSYDVNPDTSMDTFSLTVYNNNLNDIRISDFGLLYGGEAITYISKYWKLHPSSVSDGVVIGARNSIVLQIPVADLENLIRIRNKARSKAEAGVYSKDHYKIKTLLAYVDDSLGFRTTHKAKAITAVLIKDIGGEGKIAKKKHFEEQRKEFFAKLRGEGKKKAEPAATPVKAEAEKPIEKPVQKEEPKPVEKPVIVTVETPSAPAEAKVPEALEPKAQEKPSEIQPEKEIIPEDSID